MYFQVKYGVDHTTDRFTHTNLSSELNLNLAKPKIILLGSFPIKPVKASLGSMLGYFSRIRFTKHEGRAVLNWLDGDFFPKIQKKQER